MNKKAQVWIETVLYTLIGLALMGLALGFVMPKINEARDRALVEQAISSLSSLDSKITETIQTGTGNVRQTEFLMKRGEIYINASYDEIYMILGDLAKPYSEPGVNIPIGRVNVMSIMGQKISSVKLSLTYNANVTYSGLDNDRKFTAASTPYRFYIENKGVLNNKILLNIEEISNR